MLELAPDLDAALKAGQTIIVPTAQRAAALRLGFAGQQLGAGRRAFRSPPVQSLSGWLRGQPAGVAADGQPLRRLGASEEWLLWRAAVGEAAAELSLSAAGLVDAVRQSAALLAEWLIPAAALQHTDTPEAALLRHALVAMDAQLDGLGAAAPWRALSLLARNPPRRPPGFAGFAYQTPARQALLTAWQERGTPAQEFSDGSAPASGSVARPSDPASELALLAQWCRDRLFADPQARLLVVIPDLPQRQSELRRVFDAAVGPCYAVEGGRPLSDYERVAEGVRTLQLLGTEVDLAQASQWLRGEFWAQPDGSRRAVLDGWLRTVMPPRFNAGQLLRALRAAPPALLAHADQVAAVLVELLTIFEGGTRATLGVWSTRFARVFVACDLHAGAARQRGSHARQVLQRLDELLQECAALPATLGTFAGSEAVGIFARLLARTRFEPATGDAAVTVTATLDDPVLRYDGIWVSGLHTGAFPERAHFDPFIPVAVQRKAGIVAADAAALVRQARQALQTLACRTGEFIVSAAAQAEDLELTVSPLLAPYAQQDYHGEAAAFDRAQAIRAARAVETFIDDSGLAWPAAVPLPAGTRAIELQSRCPFRAYAQLRLKADPLEEPVPGITPRERGRMLHRALELLWRQLGSSQGLAAVRGAGTQAALIGEFVTQAAAEILQGADPDTAADATGLGELRRASIVRERSRAERLIGALCDIEAARSPFTVHELEAEHRLQIAGTLINVRIDRIDRLADGSHVILDYKSGQAVTPDWEIERTTHPQLLVYLLAAGVPVSALAVAHLDPKSVVFKGIADEDARLPGIKAGAAPGGWDDQLATWRQQVAQLAAGFARGDARVDPTDEACDHCHLHAFCRIADVDAP